MRRAVALLSTVLTLGAALAPALAAQQSDPRAQARILIDAGRPEDAVAVLKPLTDRAQPDPAALLLRSTARLLMGESEAGRRDLERALQLDPAQRPGWLTLAGLEIVDKRYDAALAALEKARQLEPTAADNQLNVGAVLLLQGKLQPATEHFARYLESSPASAQAYYLVSTNYGLAGYHALAIQHLRRAIELDERSRLRARTDPNFAELETSRAFQDLLLSDTYQPPPGTLRAAQLYPLPYDGAGKLFDAVIAALQTLRQPFDPRVEVTPDWALIWGEFRIKLAPGAGGKGLVEVTAPPGKLTAEEWKLRTDRLFREILIRLPA